MAVIQLLHCVTYWLKGRVSATRDRVAPSYRKSVCCKPRVEDFNIVKTTDLIEYK